MTAITASVIVATLNEAANIDHIVDIALADERVVELIIADGGSQDMTVEKIRAHGLTGLCVVSPDIADAVRLAVARVLGQDPANPAAPQPESRT